MISFIFPTRKRPNSSIESINSILSNTENWDEIEILIACDNDDCDSVCKIQTYLENNSFKNYKLINHFKRHGYENIHFYINYLANISTKKWLWIWSDDIRLVSKNPTEILKKYRDDFLLINPADTVDKDFSKSSIIHPIIPKKWLDITGHISMGVASDSWVEYIGRILNIISVEREIIFENKSVCLDSLIFSDDEVGFGKKLWIDNNGPTKFWDLVYFMNIDVEKIKNFLDYKTI